MSRANKAQKSTYVDPSGVECAFVKRTARTPEMALAIVNPVHVSSSSSSSLFIIFNPDTQFPGNEKITLCNTIKYKNQAGMNLTPPPPSQTVMQ